MTNLSWPVALALLGLCTGLRTITPIAVLCWFAFLGRLPVQHTWTFWTASPISAVLFTLFALAEYITDKLPSTPARTHPVGLLSRILFGGLVGSLVATAFAGSLILGITIGAISAVLGTFAGYRIRIFADQRSGWPDWRVALIEDSITLAASILALSLITR